MQWVVGDEALDHDADLRLQDHLEQDRGVALDDAVDGDAGLFERGDAAAGILLLQQLVVRGVEEQVRDGQLELVDLECGAGMRRVSPCQNTLCQHG